MNTIKAPFNFVPVSEDVYFPEWAENVSHDIPFSDGESGYIDVELTAETPVYIRNWHTNEDRENKTDRYKSFSKDPSGRFFIPGTSLKGEVRSVLEMLSFGKMHIDNSMAFAQRDWENEELYTLKDPKVQSKIMCGYMRFEKNKYVIYNCGRPYRIGHQEIDTYVESVNPNKKKILASHFCKNSGFDINKPKDSLDPKSAEFKYKLLEGVPLEKLRFTSLKEKSGKKIVKYDPYGKITGDIVLTGSPDQWKPNEDKESKYYEYVFPCETGKYYPLSEEKIKEYRFIYSDNKAFMQLDRSGKAIPVFFRIENGEIKDFGLTSLYKLPYNYTPYELLPESHKSSKPDLAETIFGRAGKMENESLKGRVQFSHLYAADYKECNDVTLTLAGPKASYYPMYIMQNGNGYKTYNGNAELAGRKRFVVRNNVWAKTSTENVDTTFRPLDKGSVFRGRIYFHNLRPMEIGAIISALTFHGTDICRHQIGLAKPYGYGRVRTKVSLEGLEHDSEWYMANFERIMRKYKPGWNNCSQIRELLSLATPLTDDDSRFKYMTLDMDDTQLNDFTTAKNNKEYLKRHSANIGKSSSLASIYDKYAKEFIAKSIAEAEEKVACGMLEEAYNLYIELQDTESVDCSGEIADMRCRIIEELRQKADNLEKEGKYQDAIDMYETLQKKWNRRSDTDIERLNLLIEEEQQQLIAQRKAEVEEKAAGGMLEEAYNLYIELQDTESVDCSKEVADIRCRIIEDLRQKADNLEKEGKYQDAIDMYETLQKKWNRNSLSDIDRQNSLIRAISKGNITEGFTLNTIPACSNTLKKWKATHGGVISAQDLEDLAASIKAQLPSAKKDLQKKWSNEKEWEPIRKQIGNELSHKLYEIIYNQ